MTNDSGYSDHSLVEKIQSSDKSAFEVLFKKHYKLFYHYFWVRTRSSEFSKDLVQDLFLRVWKNRESLDPDKSIKAFLYTSAKNLLINHYEKEKVRNNYKNELFIIQNENDVSDIFDLEEKIASLIKKLPPNVSQVFLLSRMDNMKYSEIAEHLNISVKTVEKRMSIALKVLRKAIAQFLTLIA